MIREYHRPSDKQAALALLARQDVQTLVLAGGLSVNGERRKDEVELVDIQSLELTDIDSRGKTLVLGAGVTLQALLNHPDTPAALAKSIRHQDSYNRRQVGTVAGSLLSGDGRSPFAAACYALDPILILEEHGKPPEKVHLGDILGLREEAVQGKLITEILLPQQTWLAYEYVARTPADRPVVSAAVCQWSSGRTRVVLGGYGEVPVLVLDGPSSDGADAAAADAFSGAEDHWASAEYRSETAGVLVERGLESIRRMREKNGRS